MKAVSGLEDAGDNYSKQGTGEPRESGSSQVGLQRGPGASWLQTLLTQASPAHAPCCRVLNQFYTIKGMMRHFIL